jgi:hypothetical protein
MRVPAFRHSRLYALSCACTSVWWNVFAFECVLRPPIFVLQARDEYLNVLTKILSVCIHRMAYCVQQCDTKYRAC